MTYRFTINLPNKQKKVLRISPDTALTDLHKQICDEKHLNTAEYRFQLSGADVNMKKTVGDLKSSEINLINTGKLTSFDLLASNVQCMLAPNLEGGGIWILVGSNKTWK